MAILSPAVVPSSEQDLAPEHLALLNQIRAHKELSENGGHKQFRDRATEYHRLYRGYNKLKKELRGQGRDRDAVILDANRPWGARLHIPYVFATVETIVPRILSNDPVMKALPSVPDARESAAKVSKVFERDQKRIGYEMKLQETARRAFIYGLGVQKTYWQRKTRKMRVTEPRRFARGYQMVEKTQVLYEGPQALSVDPFDWFWQPSASNIENCKWAIHQIWMDYEDILKRVQSGTWMPIDLDAVKRMGTEAEYATAWSDRLDLAGTGGGHTNRGEKHKVWEYHTGDRVVTVLDNTFVVQDAESPAYHCELPFQVFRPTPLPGEMAGVGEVEMIEQLQHELDTMRSQRRDAATIALNPPLFVQEGFVDQDIVVGPGVYNSVLGNPRESIYKPDMGDVPGSSYQEEASLKADIERVTGMSDPVMGGEGTTPSSETATGMQLLINQANVRVALKSKNMAREVIRPGARQWLSFYKQHWLDTKTVRVENPQSEDGYDWLEVGQEDFAAIEDMEPEAGSTEPDNPVQREERALRVFNQLTGSDQVDRRKLVTYYLREHDVKDAESFLLPPGPTAEQVQAEFEQTIAGIGNALQSAGVPPELIEAATRQALTANQEAPPEPEGGSNA